ncbi:MAG: peptidyl-tRNA hydrolase Pth2 [Candidatus Baldrarchaeia archaeon]
MPVEYKQVIVVRTDIKMSKGKLAAQVAHASVTAAEVARIRYHEWWNAWFLQGQKKVVLKVKSLDELIKIKEEAEREKLPVAMIQDRGLTELPPGTITALGIGPAPSERIDKITGPLPLL